MEQPGNSATAANSASDKVRREDRNVWVLTAYGIAGLTLFGVLVYYFSSYITQCPGAISESPDRVHKHATMTRA